MLGIGLLYVGAVLYINALVFLGKVSGRAVAIMNTFTGLLTLFIALYTALQVHWVTRLILLPPRFCFSLLPIYG